MWITIIFFLILRGHSFTFIRTKTASQDELNFILDFITPQSVCLIVSMIFHLLNFALIILWFMILIVYIKIEGDYKLREKWHLTIDGIVKNRRWYFISSIIECVCATMIRKTWITSDKFQFDDSIVKYSRRQASGSVTRSARRNRVQASRRIMQNGAGLPAAAPTHARDRSIYRTERPPGGWSRAHLERTYVNISRRAAKGLRPRRFILMQDRRDLMISIFDSHSVAATL